MQADAPGLSDLELLDYILCDDLSKGEDQNITSIIDDKIKFNEDNFHVGPLGGLPQSKRPWRDPVPEEQFKIISACKGDDIITFEQTGIFGLSMIAICETFLGIIISWKDTGISKNLGNYAEEWILKPLTAQSSYYESSNFGQGTFIPWTLDGVKLKMLSPVRKQSQLEDDLQSKMSQLAAAASWVSPDWFTYDFHQLSIILAIENFTFDDANVFPFLAREEGGSGCPVPWNQPITLLNYLDSFKRGIVKDAILQIMYESDAIRRSRIRALNAVAIKGIHAYKSGDRTLWKDYVNKANLLIRNGISEYEIKEFIFQTIDLQIPEALEKKAIIVDINNPVVASAISRLRSGKEILTDLDLVVYMKNEEKRQNLFSSKPFSVLFKEQEVRDEAARAQPLKVLNALVQKANLIGHDFTYSVNETPLNIVKDYIDGIRKYSYFLTSFNFTSKVRIYRQKEVDDFYESMNRRTLMETVFEKTYDTPIKFKRNDVDPLEEQKWKDIQAWLKEPDPFARSIPVGAATDDSSLLDQISRIRQESILIIFTNDYKLRSIIQNFLILTNKTAKRFAVCFLSIKEYYFLCADSKLKPRYFNEDEFYNILTDTTVDAVQILKTKYIPDLSQQLAKLKWRHPERFVFLYDANNLMRYCLRVKFLSPVSYEVNLSYYITAKSVRANRKTRLAINMVPYSDVFNKYLKSNRRTIRRKPERLILA